MSAIPFRSKQKDDNNSVIQNGEWIQRLDQALTLNPGDTFTVTDCFIDTQRLSSENLVITEDISIGFNFMFFETNHDFTDKTTVSGTNAADYEKYLVYHRDPSSNKLTPVIKTKEITLPAGSYTPDRISAFITDEMSEAARLLDSAKLTTGNNLLIRTDDVGTGSATKLNNINWGSDPYPYASITQLSGDVESWGPTSRDDIPYYLGNGKSGQGFSPRGGGWVSINPNKGTPAREANFSHSDYHIVSSGSSGAGSGLTIAVEPISVPSGEGEVNTHVGWYGPRWDATDLPNKGRAFYYSIVDGGSGYQIGDQVYFSSDSFGFLSPESNNEVRYSRCPTGGTLTLTVEAISADGSGYFEFIKVGEDPTAVSAAYKYNADAPYYIGASEVDLEFSDDNNGAFSWNYLHTPIYKNEKDQPLQPAIMLVKDGTTSEWSTVDVDSGILLTGLKPTSFWQDTLNFPIQNIIVKDANGEPITNDDDIKIDNIDGKFTNGYVGLNGYLNTSTTSQARKVPTADLTIATTLTNPLQADEFATNTGAGHFLIQFEGFYNQHIVTGQGVFQATAVVSKQYNNSDIVWSQGGIPYVHKGEPIAFDSFKVRVIDPDTNEVDQTLGDDNYIYSEIIPAMPVQNAENSKQ